MTPRRPRDCGNTARYRGKRVPKCAGGKGCDKCWEIYTKFQLAKKGGSYQHRCRACKRRWMCWRAPYQRSACGCGAGGRTST